MASGSVMGANVSPRRKPRSRASLVLNLGATVLNVKRFSGDFPKVCRS